ncbi:hypothetical protein KAU51_04085 [Candidatus Parcubacteria bacterium]|nr:hypothetical protein [Candidatus Parcubacteria bacterium]
MKTKLERLEIIQEEWIMKKERAEVELKLATKMQLEGQAMTIKIQHSKMEMSVCDSFISFVIDLIAEEKKKPTKLAKD